MSVNIAIDGPAGAGKSSVSKAVAAKLGYIYMDTGALYRAVAYFCLQKGVSAACKDEICGLLNEIKLSLSFENGVRKVFLNGKDVSDVLYSPEVSMAASAVSAIPEVRKFLFDLQLEIAAKNDIIMDGRDIGTVVLPNADVKIFLTASPEVRAKRRYLQLIADGKSTDNVSYEDILSDVIKRDYNDTHRDIAPLKQADDAILVDSGDITEEETVRKITEIITERLSAE